MKPGDIVSVTWEYSNWWPLSLGSGPRRKEYADMSMALVLSSTAYHNAEKPYDTVLLTRDSQVVLMRSEMLEVVCTA